MRTLGYLSTLWHRRAGLPVREEAGPIPEEEIYLRARVLAEEFEELTAAMEGGNLPWIAGELADLCIVAAGTADHYGIDIDRAIEIKMEGNYDKLADCERCGGIGQYRPDPKRHFYYADCPDCGGYGKQPPEKEDGKVMKPEGWEAPDLQWALRRRYRGTAPEITKRTRVGIDPETGAERLIEPEEDE